MILRVPDYYTEFKCIADKCTDTCCAGWEIDIDEDTSAFYQEIGGEIGERIRACLVCDEQGDHTFTLKEHRRCPFLNDDNFCDIIIAAGEEALGEVCSEFPRFGIEYGNVYQKFMTLACEEAGRIFFGQDHSPVFVDMEMPTGEEDDSVNESEVEFFVTVQYKAIDILENQKENIWIREKRYLLFLEKCQEALNGLDLDDENIDFTPMMKTLDDIYVDVCKMQIEVDEISDEDRYEAFLDRFYIFDQMHVINQEWQDEKDHLQSTFNKDNYAGLVDAFLESDGFVELDYEKLLVYFTFRYIMNSIYNYDIMCYGKLAKLFTAMVLDMDALRLYENNGKYDRKDRTDVARIFSKEVEHSEENFEIAKEEVLF